MNPTHPLIAIRSVRRYVAGVVLACASLLALGSPALATTTPVSILGGGAGSGAAQFGQPAGVAVNPTTGDLYVADHRRNRVQEFAEDGSFLRMWGHGVTASGPDDKPGVNEVKSVVISASSGTFTLALGGVHFFGTIVFGGESTASLAVGATATTVEAALQSLASVGARGGVIAVTGAGTVASPYLFTFEGALGGAAEVLGYEYSANPEPFGSALVTQAASTVTPGSSPFEDCVAANGDSCGNGQASEEAGGMNGPLGVAVDPTTGNVYVTDEGNHRVDVFSATGEFEGAWGWGVATGNSELEFCTAPSEPTECRAGMTGSAAGEFGGAIGFPAVDPVSGNVDVADPANGRIDEFNVTTSAGHVTAVGFVRDFGEFESGSPLSVAVDNEGGVYALLSPNPGGVEKFDSAGNPVASFATEQLAGEPAPSAIAVNPGSDHVLALRQCNQAICPGAPSTAWRVFEFDRNGKPIGYERVVVDTGLHEWHSEIGLAAAAAGGNIYVTAAGWNEVGEDQSLFTLNEPVPPTAEVAAASGVTAGAVVLHGTVAPNENPLNQIQTDYQFEYSLDGRSWRAVPGTGKAPASMSAIAVEQAVTGLESNTVYHVRLHASKEFAAGDATSANTTEFKTDSAAPTVQGLASSKTQASSAVVEAQVNPQGERTTYRFEYGSSESYGSTPPEGEGDAGTNVGDVSVRARLDGLLPGTLYHYRVVASNSRGSGEAKGTFTTTALTPPEVATGDYSALTQNGVTVSGTVNTQGLSTTYGFEVGTSTSYGPPTGLGSVGAGVSQAGVSLSLNGLQPGTVYHYRITASNLDGTSYGEDRVFTTASFADVFATPPLPLPFVAVPAIAFPGGPTVAVVKAKTKKQHKLAKKPKKRKQAKPHSKGSRKKVRPKK